MKASRLLLAVLTVVVGLAAFGASAAVESSLSAKGKHFDRVFIIILENQPYVEYQRAPPPRSAISFPFPIFLFWG